MNESKNVSSFEDIFNLIGGIGISQVIILFLVGYEALPNAMASYLVIFTQAIPDHRCSIPVLDTEYNLTDSQLISLAIPNSEGDCNSTSYDPCLRYKIDWEEECGGKKCSQEELIQISENGREETEYCENGYVWDTSVFKNTATEEFEFLCTSSGQAWQVLTASSLYIGNIVGSFITGWLSDTFGRKFSMIGMHFGMCLTMLAEGFIRNEYGYILCRFLQGITGMAAYIPAFVYCVEVVSSKYRAFAGFFFHTYYTVGQMTLGLMGYYVRDWRNLTKSISLWFLPFLIAFLLPETPQYTHRNGKKKETLKTLKKIGKINGKVSDSQRLSNILDQIPVEENEDDSSKNVTILDLFKQGSEMTVMVLKSSYLWLASSTVYYGIALNTGNLPGSIYTNTVINGCVDFVGHVTFPFLVESKLLGRKWTMFMGLILSCISCLVVNITVEFKSCDNEVLSQNIDTAVLIWAYIGKLCIGGTFATAYQYSAELFPTVVRNNALSIGSVIGKIFTTLTPVIMAMGLIATWLPGVVFAVIAALGGVVVLSLPETRGIPNLQTYDQAKRFYKTGKFEE